MKRSLTRVCAASLLVALAGRAANAAGNDTPFVIPVITSMTGSGAFVGKQAENTLRRLESTVNRHGGIRGVPVRFEIYDDQAKPQVAVQLLSDIEAKGYRVVLGPSLTNACLAIQPFVQDKIVDYCLSPGLDPAKGSFAFAASVSGPDIFSAMARYFHKRGWNRIASLTTSDATGQQADQRLGGAVALPENKGALIVAQEHFAPSDLTVAAQISRIKAAQPDVTVVWVIGTPFATVLRSMSDAGFTVPVFASNSNMIYDELLQLDSIVPPTLLFSGPQFLGTNAARSQRATVNEFYSVTRDVGVKPDFALSLAWDPALLIISALRQLGTTASAEQVHEYLEHLRGFPGILGVYDFTDGSQRGLTQRDLTIMRWDGKAEAWIAVSKPGGDPL
jgi:branched-chain amino acid transport system substrate-binding protein